MYLTYIVAEWLGVSGVLAVVILGLIMSAVGSSYISPGSLKAKDIFMDQLGWTANTIIFMYRYPTTLWSTPDPNPTPSSCTDALTLSRLCTRTLTNNLPLAPQVPGGSKLRPKRHKRGGGCTRSPTPGAKM